MGVMRVLMISTDKKIFDENSAVRQRIVEYGKLVDELQVVVFSRLCCDFRADFLSAKGGQKIRSKITYKNKIIQIPNTNFYLYSTNSINRWFYVFDAIKIGKKIVRNWKLEIKILFIK